MDIVPLYVKLGSILGIVSTVVVLVLNLQTLINIFRSFGIWSYKQIRCFKILIRDWRFWKQYRPSCLVEKVGDLEIKKVTNNFYADYRCLLEMDVRYTSNDSRYTTSIDLSAIKIKVFNNGRGRDKAPYWMHRIEQSIIEQPQDIGRNLSIGLPSGKSILVRYKLSGEVLGHPLLNESALCRVITIGEAVVHGVSHFKKLKTTNPKFSVLITQIE
jgi:hypothetical protein